MKNTEPAYLELVKLETKMGEPSPYHIASIVLNRPKQANAFNSEMLTCIHKHLETVKADKSIRLLLFQGADKNFTAGADLKWLLETAHTGHEDNVAEATKLTDTFEMLSYLEIPTIAVVRGAVYGGGVGIVACCDYAIATETAEFCLNEAKLGTIPGVVLPYINRKTACGQLRRLVLGGRIFTANEAKEYGLVQVLADTRELNHIVSGEVNQLLEASPEAQGSYKRLQKYLGNNSYQQGPYTAAAVAIARASDFGLAGIKSFVNKEYAPWLCRIPEDKNILAD